MKYIKLFENFSIDIYEHGRCELFAIALHKELDYDIYFFIDNNAEFETEDGFDYGDALIHAYCKDEKNNCFDATGLVTISDIEDDHCEYVDEPEHIKVSDEMFEEYVRDGFIGDYDENEISKIRNYIKYNYKLYSN